MPAQHHHFVLLIRPRNLGDGVVGGSPFGVGAIDDVEFEVDRGAIGQDSSDSSVVFVSDHDRWDGFSKVKRSVVERDDLTVFAAGVVHANDRAVINEKLIDLGLQLSGWDCAWPWSLLTPSAAAPPSPALSRVRVVWIVTSLHVVIGVALGGRCEVHG